MSENAIIEYRKTVDDLAVLDGEISFDANLSLPPNKPLFIRVIKAQLTKQLPNIYEYGNFDNTRIGLTRDGGVSWVVVVLPPGIYTLEYLEYALNEAVAVAPHLWWTLATDPGFEFTFNLATQKINVYMDSSKLAAPGILGIDFDSYSDANLLVGFDPVGPILDSGPPFPSLFPAPNYPQFDTQGTAVDIISSFNLVYSYQNSKNTDVIASIPLTGSNEDHDEFLYPIPGQVSPYMQVTNTSVLSGITLTLVGSRARPIVSTNGNFFITIELVSGHPNSQN